MKNIQTSIPISLLFIILVLGVLLYLGLDSNKDKQFSENVIDTSLIIDNQYKFDELTSEIEKLKLDIVNITEKQKNLTLLKDNHPGETVTEYQTKKIESPDSRLSTNTIAQNVLPLTPEAERAEVYEQARVQREFYDTTLSTEAIDPNWSLSTEQKIDEIFEKLDVESSSLISKECRTNLCKVELVQQDIESLESFYDNFTDAIEWDFESNLQVLDEGGDSITAVLYLSREGQSLPNIQN